MKQIIIDLEISPEFTATYGKHHEAQVLEVERYQYLFCFSYKEPRGKVITVSLRDFPSYKRQPYNDKMVVKELHSVLSQYEYVVAHNTKFDIGFAKTRFMYWELPPIQFPKSFCTLSWARRNLHLNSYSLKNVAHYFKVTEKMETSKGLWQRIHYHQDRKAWDEMEKYNAIDVIVTDQIHEKMAAWDAKMIAPRFDSLCQNPRCQSNDVRWHGIRGTKHRFTCRKCGLWGAVKVTSYTLQ